MTDTTTTEPVEKKKRGPKPRASYPLVRTVSGKVGQHTVENIADRQLDGALAENRKVAESEVVRWMLDYAAENMPSDYRGRP